MLARLHDPLLAVLSVGQVALLLLLLHWVQRRRPFSPFLLRKLVHTLVGLLTLVMTILFQSRGWALVPPVLFTVVNFSPKLRSFLPELAQDEKTRGGLWMFPLGVVLVYLLFWTGPDRGPVLAGLAALGLADPVAALVGSRFGQRKFAGFGYGRTMEGSLAFLLVAGVAGALIASATPGAPAVRVGVGCGAVGAIAEALSPHGFDNVTVPLLVAAAYRVLA